MLLESAENTSQLAIGIDLHSDHELREALQARATFAGTHKTGRSLHWGRSLRGLRRAEIMLKLMRLQLLYAGHGGEPGGSNFARRP